MNSSKKKKTLDLTGWPKKVSFIPCTVRFVHAISPVTYLPKCLNWGFENTLLKADRPKLTTLG